jgi:hypothetical protein
VSVTQESKTVEGAMRPYLKLIVVWKEVALLNISASHAVFSVV